MTRAFVHKTHSSAQVNHYLRIVIFFISLLLFCGCRTDHRFVKKAVFKDSHEIAITFAGPVDEAWAENMANFSVYEKPDPDILSDIRSVVLSPDRMTLTIHAKEPISQEISHKVVLKEIISGGVSQGTAYLTVKKLYIGHLFSILMGAMIIQNFVFSKYLGLCVFFGTSRKKSTAVGMGITFTIVIIAASLMSWFFYQFVLKPFRLDYLQLVVFIGLVSLTVQGVDTILRKVNPALFKAFGVYLVLVIANCIVIAVPLILADNEYNLWESLMLATGAGLGFLIALFLMSCVRERLEFANIPESYRGLPIAFIVAGLFALAFMGFSGMSLF
ncbi:Rnf-Nqr domain containing protein [Desulfobacterales bacterium HSG2]|nr:Rnf-Nqr domain containing protein [Desulfobacterales bacterium HSG2]